MDRHDNAKTQPRMLNSVHYKAVGMDKVFNIPQAAFSPTLTMVEKSKEANVETVMAEGCRVIIEAAASAAREPQKRSWPQPPSDNV